MTMTQSNANSSHAARTSTPESSATPAAPAAKQDKRANRFGTMTESTTRKTYDIWSRIYDDTFGRLVARRQRLALEQFHLQPGDRVLDLGVGTGLTLQHYPKDIHIVGMDLSRGMLTKAADKLDQNGLTHCQLICGDAMLPPMREASFDHVMISHTISVVSQPAKLLQWARSLVKPGGRIVLLNHFNDNRSLIGKIERWLNPLCVKIGWRSDLTLEEAMGDVDLDVAYTFKMRRMDVWQIVVLHRPASDEHHDPADKTISEQSGEHATRQNNADHTPQPTLTSAFA